MKRLEQRYLLDRSGVDAVSAEVDRYLAKAGIKRENAARLRLTMEELLLDIRTHFDGSVEGMLVIGSRFGTPYLRFRYAGESYDPVSSVESAVDELTRQILSNLGLAPTWSYRNGVNELYLRGPHRTVTSEMRLIGAVVCAVLVGFLGASLPASVTESLSGYVLSPLSSLFMNLLNTFVGIMVFLSVVTGISSVGTISNFSKMGKTLIGHLVVISFVVTGLCIVLMMPLYQFGGAGASTGSATALPDTELVEVTADAPAQTAGVIDMLLDIVPSNPVTPFAERNMIQIVIMAIMTGCALLVLENRTALVREFAQQMNALVLQVVQGICRFLPVYIFVSLVLMLWENGFGLFFRLWKVLVIYIAAMFLAFLVKLLYTCLKLHLRPGDVFSCVKKPMLIGYATASSATAFGTMLDINEKRLGISGDLSRFGTPLSILHGTAHGAMLVSIVYYLSEYYAVPVSFGWFLTAWIMCAVFSMTIPPVSGGTLVVTGLLMTQLNIPQAGLAVAGILGIFMDFIATGTRIGLIQLELLLDAAHLKMWNRSILQRDS